MAVYYKFKSAKDYDSISMDGHFISVETFKARIFESKHFGRGTDFDLVVTNAQTNEEYLDEAMLIPKNTSVIIRRVPGRPRMTIVTQPDETKEETVVDDVQPKSNLTAADSSVMKDFEVSDFDDDFGHDLYATIPEVAPGQNNNILQDSSAPSKADEDSKIKALVENSGFDWQRQGADGFGSGRGFGRGGRGGRGFGRGGGPGCGGGMERKTPPQGYVCHRCKVPGHFIQHCPTNGDPNFDVRKVKPATGIPKSMLVPTPDGSYALPSGTAAVLKPNEAAFEREIEGLPSTRSVGDLPPELHCPLCKEVMKDAVLTSRCCFKSFCDKCIRDYIISKSVCICGATDILADDLLPNKTLRDTINRILESGNSSADNAGSAVHVQDMESARCPPPRNPSPTQSAASKGEQKLPPNVGETPAVRGSVDGNKPSDASQHQMSEKEKMIKVPDVSEATHESASVREPASQGSALPVEEEVQQRVAVGDPGKKKKKKKKMPLPVNGADMQWMGMPPGMDGYMGPPNNFNPYWQGMQPPMDGFMGPFGNMPFNMGYGPGPMDMPFGNVMPPDPFMPPPMFPPMFPPPPQRDLAAEFGMNMNVRPLSREEFQARQAEVRRKREMERRVESREFPKDRDFREVSSSANGPPMKSKPRPPSTRRSPSEDRYERERERARDPDLDHHRERERSRDRPPMDRERDRERSRDRPPMDRERDRERSRDRPPMDRERDRERSRDRPPMDRERDRERSRDRPPMDRERDRERSRDRPLMDREREQDGHHLRSSHSHRSERASPDRSSRDKDISRPKLKRKSEHREPEHEKERHREREVEHEVDRERRHRHRSESKPQPPATAAETAQAQAALDKKKASVFSRISFPEEEPAKKRKLSAEPKTKSSKSVCKDHESGVSGSGHHHDKTTTSSSVANGYHPHQTLRKTMSIADSGDYESSDDERHFKRKPLRYEPSPPPREEWVDADEEDGRRHRKHR